MKKIQVLGPGCARCNQLADNVREALRVIGRDCEVEKITDLNRIASFGVMLTPALAIDGEVKLVGKVPSVKELAKILG